MIIVTGEFHLPEGKLADALPHMTAMLKASRAEPGCLHYVYGVDVEDGTTIHVTEYWTSEEDLEAHLKTEHLRTWRARCAELGAYGRSLKRYKAEEGVHF